MDQLRAVWSGLEPRRRVIVVAATLAMFVAILVFGRMASTPSYALLYGGLEPGAAGEIITHLEQQAVPYQVRGSSIYVDKSVRDQLRMTLANQGLPAKGVAGYELLDSLSGFSTTSQMFDATYWRAKEGELARTIMSSPQIKSARVLIASPVDRPFQRNAAPSASVVVRTVSGGLSSAYAKSLRYLVAAAVTGMKPMNVAVIDGEGHLVAGPEAPGQQGAAASDLAAQLKRKIERILQARVGLGNAVAEVSIDTVTDTETVTHKQVDPTSRVTVSTDKQDQSSNATQPQGGAVTVASNLPTGSSVTKSGSQNASQNNQTHERINYDFSQTDSKITRPPGRVKRITVAVLVNGLHATAADGTRSWKPRGKDEISALRELVQSTMGFDAKRGDVVTIRSLQFEARPAPGVMAKASFMSSLGLDPMALVQLALVGLVVLLLGLFVLRPILAQGRANALPKLAPPTLDGEINPVTTGSREMQLVPSNLPPSGAINATHDNAGTDPVARLRLLIEERQDETVKILRSWMAEGEETA